MIYSIHSPRCIAPSSLIFSNLRVNEDNIIKVQEGIKKLEKNIKIRYLNSFIVSCPT